MRHTNRGVVRPASLRQPATAIALSLSVALIAGPAFAQNADAGEVELETLKIEGRTADVNPYASEGAPYKARVSGDARRVKPLAETPATINVITEAQIEESGRNDLRSIIDAQPGITVGTGETGNQFGDRYIIRGQEARGDVFVDGLRDPGLQSRESFAVEQIEITKGPSATFAGRGASGGSVNSITKQATTDYDFHNIELTAGSDSHIRGTIDSNLRVSEKIAVRANLLFMREDVPDRSPAERKRYGAAVAVKADASEDVSFLLDYYHLTARDRPDLGQAVSNAAATPPNRAFRDIPAYAQKEDFQNADVDVITGRVQINAFGDFRIENSMRYGRTKGGYLASTVARFNRGANDPVAPGALDYRVSGAKMGWQKIEYFADRANLVGEFETGSLKHNLVAGVEYTNYSVDNSNNSSAYAFTAPGAFNCINGGGSVLNAWCVTDGKGSVLGNADNLLQRTPVTRNPNRANSWKVDTMAGYLMDSVDVTPWLNIAGGVRFDIFTYDLATYNTTTTARTNRYRYSDTLWSYNASVTVKPASNGIVYLAWATGADINGGESDVGTSCGYGGLCSATDGAEVFYKSAPERSENIELGTKWDLFDDKLLITAAAFQITKKGLMEGGNDSYLATGSLNSGKHRVRGVEFGFVGNVTSKLTGQLGVTLMESKVRKSIIADNIGRRLANFADDSVDAQLRYQATDRLAFGGTATYQSKVYGGQPDTAAAWNATAGTYSIHTAGYTTYDAFVSYKLNENFGLRLNALNLTDKKYYVAVYRSGSFAYLGDARTVRLTLSGKF